MPLQDTSIETYDELVREGKIGMNQRRVLALITYYPDRTDQELTDLYASLYKEIRDPNAVRPRRNELYRKGYVTESGRRRCGVTGRSALTWRVCTESETGQLELLL